MGKGAYLNYIDSEVLVIFIFVISFLSPGYMDESVWLAEFALFHSLFGTFDLCSLPSRVMKILKDVCRKGDSTRKCLQ